MSDKSGPVRRPEAEQGPTTSLQLAHLGQELRIGLSLGQALDQQFHGFYRRQRVQNLAKNPDAREVVFRDQQLFLSSAGALNVDGREGALVDQLAVENDFRVTRALKFFKDHVVHA